MARHIERCQPKPRKPLRDSQFTAELDKGARATPAAWYMGHEYLAHGIEKWARTRLDDYKFDCQAPNAKAFFLAATAVRTREIPSPLYSEAASAPDATICGYRHPAWKFTKAIENSLREMTKHCHPILMSIGIDGFACHAELVFKFLKRVPKFTLLVRETELSHGLNEKFSRSRLKDFIMVSLSL